MDEPLRGYGWVGVEWDDFGNAATPSAGTHLFNKLAVENLLYEFRYLRFPLLGEHTTVFPTTAFTRAVAFAHVIPLAPR
jgi:hypothetical protein